MCVPLTPIRDRRSLERAAAERSKTPDKAAILRRNSSLKTVLPAGLSSGDPPVMPPPTPDLVETRQVAPPQPISNTPASSRTSRVPSLRASLAPASSTAVAHAGAQTPKGDGEEYVEALYDFGAEIAGEMSITKGDVIKVTKKIDDGWWEGQCNGSTGMFPANYVRPTTTTVDAKRPPLGDNRSSMAMQNSSSSLRVAAPSSTPCCTQCGCQDFVANVFKPGKCNNCFHQH